LAVRWATENLEQRVFLVGSDLRAAGIRSQDIPRVSFSIAEPELQTLALENIVGDYAAWTYLQSIDSPESRAFVERLHARYGADRVISEALIDLLETA